MEMVFGPDLAVLGGLPAIVPLVLDVCLIAFSEKLPSPGWSTLILLFMKGQVKTWLEVNDC